MRYDLLRILACLAAVTIPVQASEPFAELRASLSEEMGIEFGPCTSGAQTERTRNSIQWCGESGLEFPEFRKRFRRSCQRIRFLHHYAAAGWNRLGGGLRSVAFWYREVPGHLLFHETSGEATFILQTAVMFCEDAGLEGRGESGLYATGDTPGIEDPVRKRYVEPSYPESARRDRKRSLITLEGILTTEGVVDGLCILKAVPNHYDLNLAAVRAVEQWVYRPAILDGEPVEILMSIDVAFRLH
jgi:TonB family protein